MATEQLLECLNIDSPRRREIIAGALDQAKAFWEDRLKQFDLSPDEIMMGRRRLTQINAKIEKLFEDQNPQS